MNVEALAEMLMNKENELKQMINQFNQQIAHIQGEISMIKQMIEVLEKKALASEDDVAED